MARNMPMAMNQGGGMSPQQQFAMLNQQPKRSTGTKIGQFFTGKPGQAQFLPTQTGPQNQLQGLTIQNLMQMLSGGMGGPQQYQQAFEPYAQNAREQFTSQGVPGLAERFTALGGGGGQNSSAFQGALAQAKSGLESNLAGMGAQFGQQQQQLDQNYLLQLLQFALSPQFETQYKPATGGLFGHIANNVGAGLNAAAKGAGAYYGGGFF